MHQTFSSNKDIEFLIDFRMSDEIDAFHQTFECARESIHFNFKMVDLVTLVVLNELMDSDD